MKTLDRLQIDVLTVHAMLVLMPALLLIVTTFWVLALRRLARAAREAGVVHRADNLFDPGHEDAAETTPPAVRTDPPPHQTRRYG